MRCAGRRLRPPPDADAEAAVQQHNGPTQLRQIRCKRHFPDIARLLTNRATSHRAFPPSSSTGASQSHPGMGMAKLCVPGLFETTRLDCCCRRLLGVQVYDTIRYDRPASASPGTSFITLTKTISPQLQAAATGAEAAPHAVEGRLRPQVRECSSSCWGRRVRLIVMHVRVAGITIRVDK